MTIGTAVVAMTIVGLAIVVAAVSLVVDQIAGTAVVAVVDRT